MTLHEWRSDFAALDFKRLRERVREALHSSKFECLMHPLGFHFVRVAVQESSAIRLHYWRPNDRAGTALTPYHDHVWRLHSCVLVGELENILLDVRDDVQG